MNPRVAVSAAFSLQDALRAGGVCGVRVCVYEFMCVYECVHVCMCVFVYVFICAYVHVCIGVYVSVPVPVSGSGYLSSHWTRSTSKTDGKNFRKFIFSMWNLHRRELLLETH